MKKFIFGGFAVLLALALITCDGETPNIINNGDLIDVEYSADGRSLTIYLEGGVPRKTANRALSSDLTRMGHDFYEVIFYDGTNVTRASWEIGESVGVRNVPRGAVGVGINYSLTGAGTTTLTAPASGYGYAALFVGRKDDKTLLAVGRLTAVNGSATTTINENSTSVTFTVAAFDAGASSTAANSSFLTASNGTPSYAVADVGAANTSVQSFGIGGNPFPLFHLPYDSVTHQATVAARYTVSFVAAATATDFWPAVRLAAPTSSKVELRQPRMPIGGSNYYVKNAFLLKASATAAPADGTLVAITNNITGTAGSTNFTNGIEFLFTTAAVALPGIFSFNFEVPVVAVTDLLPSPNPSGIASAITWYVRPAYGTGAYDLDNGNRGSGGCILMGYRPDQLPTIEVSTSSLN